MIIKLISRSFGRIFQRGPTRPLLEPRLVSLGLVLVIMLPVAAGIPGKFRLGAAEAITPQQSRTGPIPPIEVLRRDSLKPPERAEDVLSETILPVPAYTWRHGCGPTALGMVVGYYDLLGYGDLIPGSADSQTSAVSQAIASGGDASNPYPSGSERHYEDYARPQDYSPPLLDDDYITSSRAPHEDDSLADYMDTSKSTRSNYYGWSWSSDMGPAFVDYINQQNAAYTPTYQSYYSYNGTLTWSAMTNEIDAGRPMVFLVDTDANGGTDHFVTVMGYRTSPALQYGVRDTWTSAVRWENFASMAPGVPWGIWGGWSLHLNPIEITCDHITEVVAGDCGALQSFYDHTNGDEWGNWFTTMTPCSTPWTGLTYCESQSVIDLLLDDQGITGSLPPEFGNFSALEQLKLNDNNLSGNIPGQLNNLGYTAVVDLSNNEFSGPIPGGLHGEFSINLSRNRLSGNIPVEWRYVEALDLSRNQLSGDVSLDFMKAVENFVYDLDIGYNMLTVSNPTVGSWLEQVDPDWFQTQTVPPANLNAAPQSMTSIQLTWDPIAYQADGGYYQISYGISSSANESLINTANKSESSHMLTGLEPDQSYYFKIRTYTPAHDTQKNDLTSTYSAIVPAKTFAPAAANFSASPTTGEVPLVVAFTNQSSGGISSWSWNFGDGGTSSQQNPSHIYTEAGSFTVSLTVSGPGGADTETKSNYIQVSEPVPAPVANFSASPTAGEAPLMVVFSDESSGNIRTCVWNFGDGSTSNQQNPNNTYTAAGIYTVSLTTSGPGGSNTETKANYIQVSEPFVPRLIYLPSIIN